MLRSACKTGVCSVCIVFLVPLAFYAVSHYYDFIDKLALRSAFFSGTDEEFLLFMMEDEEISAAFEELLHSGLRLLLLAILAIGSLICYTGFAVCPKCWCCCWVSCCFFVFEYVLLMMSPSILNFLAVYVKDNFVPHGDKNTDDRFCDADIGIC